MRSLSPGAYPLPKTAALYPRSTVCQILGVSEPCLRLLLEWGLLASPDCADGLCWRPSALLQFIWRRASDEDFEAAVQEAIREAG